MGRFLLPLTIFLIVVAFLGVGLRLNPHEIPSPLIDKPAPAFSLPHLHHPEQVFSPKELAGTVWLLNVWASWCGGCRDEHPLLVGLAARGEVPIYGLDYKDRREAALAWLKELGNPFPVSAMDLSGRVGIDYGVYGVPETFVIDKQGVIRFKQIGPLDHETLENTILPLVRELEKS